MTLNELIESLETLREELGDGDMQVLVASQPSYPLRNRIANVTGGDLDEDANVWIAVTEDYDRPYAPRSAWTD